MSSFNPGDFVWANFAGVWYPGIVTTPDQLPDGCSPDEIPVYFTDGSGAALEAKLIEPIENDYEARKSHPDVLPVWDAFAEMMNGQTQQGDEVEGETQKDHDDDVPSSASESGDDAEDAGEDEDTKAAKKAAKAERRAERKERKRLKAEAKEARRREKEERKKKDKKSKKEKKDDEINEDDLAAFLGDDDANVDMSYADRSQPAPRTGVRRTQIASATHLEQPAGRIANLQMSLLKAHYNQVLASDVAGGNARLMPVYERDYLSAAERAIQRRTRTERFLALALKKASDSGNANTPAAQAIKESHESLRSFDLAKAFGLPNPDGTPRTTVPAADAVELRTVGRGQEGIAGAERLKHVTRLYYRDQLTSIADGTSLVPVEAMPVRGARRADLTQRGAMAMSQGLGGGLSQGSALLGGRFSSMRQVNPPMLLQATNETSVMTQWRLFRALPPRDEQHDAQFIPPVGALAQRFDEAGQRLWQKAYKHTVRALVNDDKLILNATAQTTETRLGLNIGYNDIPAAGGPPAGLDEEVLANDEHDIISRQLRELGETLERDRTTQGGKSQLRTEAAKTFLELTQRAGGLADVNGTQLQPTQFNFHDFGESAAKRREQRADMGSVEHGSALPMDSLGSHLVIGSPLMQNPLTPVNYGYDLEEAYRSDVQPAAGEFDDVRTLRTNDLPSVASLWEKGSIAEGVTAPTRGSQRDSGTLGGSLTNPSASQSVDPRKTVRELFLKEAKALTVAIDALLSQSSSTTFRSASGAVVKQNVLRDVIEYLRDVANVRAIVEKLTERAVEQLQSRLATRAPGDASPIVSTREAQQLRNSFRRQIERAHRIDTDGLSKLVPSTITGPTSDAARSTHSDARSTHSRSTGISVRSSAVGQRRSRERAYDE